MNNCGSPNGVRMNCSMDALMDVINDCNAIANRLHGNLFYDEITEKKLNAAAVPATVQQKINSCTESALGLKDRLMSIEDKI